MTNREKVCRCCMLVAKAESDLHDFSSEIEICEHPSSFIKINTVYNDITTIHIPLEDEERNKICSTCLGDLKYSYLFKERCQRSAKIYESISEDNQEEQFCFEDSQHMKEEENEEDACYIEYIQEEFIDEPQNLEDGESSDSRDHEQHESVPAENEIIACDLCPKTFDRKDYYRRHFRRVHLMNAIQEKTIQLTEEGKTSEIPHLNLHQCEFCGKITICQEDYLMHKEEHEGEHRFKCKKCSSTFDSKDECREHLNTAHSSTEKPFFCEICSKSFKNRYQLILHTRSHTGEKPFKCPFETCGKAFSMSSNLQKHLDTHSSEKPYQCTYCDQYFKTQRSLKFHTVCYHQPEAKVKCPTCEKSFVNRSYLKMHMLYHTGEKNYTCSICNGKYYKSSHLKRHIQNVHLKLRLMKCDFCTADFVRKETYKSHIISHHKRHLTEEEYEEVIEKIKKFQPPALDVKSFTMEKLKNNQTDLFPEEIDMINEEDELSKSNESMIIEQTEYNDFFEEDVEEQ